MELCNSRSSSVMIEESLKELSRFTANHSFIIHLE